MSRPKIARGLHAYEVRILAAAGLAVAVVYGAFMALFGVLLAEDCPVFGHCDDWFLMAPVMGVATMLALLSIHRASPALWTAAKTGQRRDAPFRRLGVAWLAAFAWGLVTVYPAVMQVLYTGLALPVVLGLLVLGRVGRCTNRCGFDRGRGRKSCDPNQ